MSYFLIFTSCASFGLMLLYRHVAVQRGRTIIRQGGIINKQNHQLKNYRNYFTDSIGA